MQVRYDKQYLVPNHLGQRLRPLKKILGTPQKSSLKTLAEPKNFGLNP